MSRIGRQPISLPDGIDVKVEGSSVVVKGSRGSLIKEIPRSLSVKVEENKVLVEPKKNDKATKALHGTYRALIANMVTGVSDGWSKELELVGTGYRTELNGERLVLTVGFSHPVELEVPKDLNLKVEKTNIIVEGMDKELVGQFAAEVRAIRPPEPYKGKGIKYKDEVVRRKAGKAAKASEGAA
jgi:large subunit ribosomal protein L6